MLTITGISFTLIWLGPAVLAAVVAATLVQRRHERLKDLNDGRRARIIAVSAVFAMVLVTIGILIIRR